MTLKEACRGVIRGNHVDRLNRNNYYYIHIEDGLVSIRFDNSEISVDRLNDVILLLKEEE